MIPPTRLHRWQRWSVTALGVLLCGVIAGVIVITRTELTTLHRLQTALPVVLALGLTGYGTFLARSALPTERITRIALWSLAGSVVIGSFAMWELSLDLAEGEALAETVYVLLRGGTEGALIGGLVGYYNAQRREQYQETERANRAITASIDGIALLNEEGRYTEVNQAHADVYGYDSPEDFLGNSWQMCYTDAERERIEQEIFPTLLEDGHWRGELTGTRRDGSPFPQEATLTVNDDGSMVCVVRDITECKRREQQLYTLHDATRDMMAAPTRQEVADIACEAASDILELQLNGVYFYDEDANGLVPVAASQRGEDVVGRPPVLRKGASIGWRVFERGEAELYDDVRTAPGVSNSETPIRSELLLPLEGHGIFIAGAVTVGDFDDSDVSLANVLAATVQTALDRVDREQALRTRERELQRQTDRLDAFAGMVSHDLRNPLNVATGHLELAEETGGAEHFEVIARAHDRMDRIIQDVLAVAREGDAVGDTDPLALDAVARRAWATVETGPATFQCDTDQEIEVDASRVSQLFENLFRNSVEHGSTDNRDGSRLDDAIEHGGEEVTVRVGWLAERTGFYVEDTGPGIPPEERASVFESGYTTETEGTGFGLAIVEEIAAAHGWEITITDGTDGGARFEITTEPGKRKQDRSDQGAV